MSYWIDDRKEDIQQCIKECKKDNDNECDTCPYMDICDDIEIELGDS